VKEKMSARIGSFTNTMLGLAIFVIIAMALYPTYTSAIQGINETGGLWDAVKSIAPIVYPAAVLGIFLGALYMSFRNITGSSSSGKRRRRRK